jgi:UDP-GlcNAc:undecaprenyl-phosphate GlcNAc-1-phosphate transferase
VLYIVTALFAGSAILTYFKPKAGVIMILVLLLLSDIFIEYTGMINPKWHPLLSISNKLFGKPKMEEGEDPVDTAYLIREQEEEAEQEASKESIEDKPKDSTPDNSSQK